MRFFPLRSGPADQFHERRHSLGVRLESQRRGRGFTCTLAVPGAEKRFRKPREATRALAMQDAVYLEQLDRFGRLATGEQHPRRRSQLALRRDRAALFAPAARLRALY